MIVATVVIVVLGLFVSKTTYSSVTRDLGQCPKRPTIVSMFCQKRPAIVSNESCNSVKRDLH